MKKLQKQVFALLLVCIMAVSAVVAAPVSASAANAKTKSKTVTVTDTKISGFNEIRGTVTLNNKYVIAYGKDKKGNNIYSYSKDGKKFGKAKKVGLSGDYINYQAVGKNLYVLNAPQSSAPAASALSYKCVTDPAKLTTASVKKVQVTFPSNYTPSSIYYNTYGYGVDKSGKLYLSASSSGNLSTSDAAASYGSTWSSMLYSIVLNGTKSKIVDLYKVTENALKNSEFDIDSSIQYYYNYNASSSSVKGFFTAKYYKDNIRKTAVFYTTNGTSFKRLADVPSPANPNSIYSIEWMGKNILAYRSSCYENGSDDYTLEGKGTYYLYNSKTNKWDKKSIGKTGYSMSYNTGAVDVSFYNHNSIGTAAKTSSKAAQILYTTNGTKWKSVTKYPIAAKKGYTIQRVTIEESGSGLVAEAVYTNGKANSQRKYLHVYSKLSKGKWKAWKTTIITSSMKSDTGDYYTTRPFSSSISSSPVSAIYNSGKKTTGYNIEKGKAYKLPFTYTGYDQSVIGGSTMIYSYKNCLYGTKNAYKNMTKITLKAGKKKLKGAIANTTSGYIKKNSYIYFIIGKKVYYTTYDKLIKAI